MRRREFITLTGGAAAASTLWPLPMRAQQQAKPKALGLAIPPSIILLADEVME